MRYNLNNKIALITGSSKGIGLEIAKRLQYEGCKVILNSRNNKELIDLTSQIKNSVALVGDVTKEKDTEKMIKEINTRYKRLDILVCNVGSGKSVKPGKENLEEWKRMININLFSTTNMVEKCTNTMSKVNGNIVCISSICGNETIPNAPITYSTAKAALNAYIKGISRPLAKKGIRINAISPGNIIFKGSTWEEKIISNKIGVKKLLETEVPLNTFGEPEDVSNLVCYLASPLAKYITGSIFNVDGGQVRSI